MTKVSRRRASCLFVAALVAGLTGRAQTDRLAPGASRTVTVDAGATRAVPFDAPASGFVRLSLERQSPALAVRVLAPDGAPLDLGARVRSQPSQHLFFLTPAAGAYRLEFALPAGAGGSQSATVTLLEVRPAVVEDTPRIAADDLTSEAAALEASQDGAKRRSAVARLEQSVPLWQAAGDRRGEADAHNRAGVILYRLGDFKASAAAHEKAVTLFEGTPELTSLAEALANQAVALQNLGQPERAAATQIRVLEIYRKAGHRRGEAYTLHNLGAALYRLGRFSDALAYYDQALAAKRALKDNTLGITISNMATTLGRLGEHRAALARNQEALALRRAAKDRRGEAYDLLGIGSTYVVLDEWPAALEHLLAAEPLFEAVGDARGHSQTLHTLGAAYEAMGDDVRATAYLDRALVVRRAIGDPATTSTTLLRLGGIARRRGELARARTLLADALDLKRQGKDRYGEAYVEAALARLDLAEGHLDAALAHARASADVSRALNDQSGLASALNELAGVLERRGAHAEAIVALRESLSLQPVVQSDRTEADSRYLLARNERARGNLEAARVDAMAALAIVETLRPRAAGGDLRSGFVASRQSYYDLAIDLLMQLDRTAPAAGHALRALEISERARATRLVDTLAEARVDIRAGVDVALLDREISLARELDARETVRARLISENGNAEVLAEVARSIERGTAELADVRTRIRAASPNYAALIGPPAPRADDIRQQLDADTLLLEYWLGDERSYLWAVSQAGVKTVELPARAIIDASVREFHALLTARQVPVPGETLAAARARIARADADAALAARKLSSLLLAPAGPSSHARWVVVTDGALEYLPFGALPDPRDQRSATPILARHLVVSAPSVAAVALMRDTRPARTPATKSVAVLADPVFSLDDPRVKSPASRESAATPRPPGDELALVLRSGAEVGLSSLPRLLFSRDEAAAIEKLVPASQRFQATDFLANRATALGESLRDYRVLHFATHALLNNEQPGLSGVVLSLVDEAGQPRNGFLRLHDLYGLQLGADLVVLSACQTALGREMRGEGLQSVARGFMYAGASSVLATLWRVDDRATSEFMTRFYREHLQRGRSAPAALQAAALELSKDPRWRAPYYWAAFTLQGEWR